MGFDHVGHHRRLNLPAVLPELSGSDAEAEGTASPVGLKREAHGK
jgi:hypothetical protein